MNFALIPVARLVGWFKAGLGTGAALSIGVLLAAQMSACKRLDPSENPRQYAARSLAIQSSELARTITQLTAISALHSAHGLNYEPRAPVFGAHLIPVADQLIIGVERIASPDPGSRSGSRALNKTNPAGRLKNRLHAPHDLTAHDLTVTHQPVSAELKMASPIAAATPITVRM